jgi:hypothetical protein
MSASAEKAAEKKSEVSEDSGKKHAKLHIITADGDCFFNSVIYSMSHHPYGNLLEKSGLPNTIHSLRQFLSSSETSRLCYTSIFEKIKSLTQAKLKEEYGVEEVYEENSKGRLKEKIRIRFPYPWIIEFLKLKKDKEAFTLEKFIEFAQQRIGYTNEFASICEVDAMVTLLSLHNIQLDIKWVIPEGEMDFGSEENPIVNIKYNGLDHYDAIVPKTGNSEGGKRKTRKMRKKKRKTYRRY